MQFSQDYNGINWLHMATILGCFCHRTRSYLSGLFFGILQYMVGISESEMFFFNEQTLGFNLEYFRICYLVRYSGRCADFQGSIPTPAVDFAHHKYRRPVLWMNEVD